MHTELVYSPDMETYCLSPEHPLQPERFGLAVSLAQSWGLLGDAGARAVVPEAAAESDLLLVHDAAYVAAVKRAGSDPANWTSGYGIGPGDTPAFAGMHEASALVAGATLRAVRDVVSRRCDRAFCPAGGLHHAHRDRAAGFCVYNDPAIAISAIIAENPGMRVAYVDVDAHHGDGVQEAFYERSDVLTASVHESGMFLYPGTGRTVETGSGDGFGFALNVPLPPDAGDREYASALAEIVGPALRAFAPDLIVAQLGADSHRDDPLAHLDTTVAGQYANARTVIAFADELCGGRIVATGGGGYDTFSAVPRAWACVLAALLGVEVPHAVPRSWIDSAVAASGGRVTPLPGTFDEISPPAPPDARERAAAGTARVIEQVLATHPLLGAGA